MSKKQSDAVKARVETVPAFASKAFKSIAPHGTALPYVVIHGADGEDSAERLAGGRVTMHPRYTLHITGEDADSIETLTAKLKAAFISNGFGIPLTVAGETCDSLWWSSPAPLEPDFDPQEPIVFQVIEIGWTADPA